MQVEIALILALNSVWHLLNFLSLIIIIFCLQLLRDVEMEPLGRRSGDSFRSISSRSQSCKRSCKKQLDRKTTKTHTAEKVRKHCRKMWKCESENSQCYLLFIYDLHYLPACSKTSHIHDLKVIFSCMCLLFDTPSIRLSWVNHQGPVITSWFPVLWPSPLSPS